MKPDIKIVYIGLDYLSTKFQLDSFKNVIK